MICLSAVLVVILTRCKCRFLRCLSWTAGYVIVDKKRVFIFFFEKGFAFRKN
jgi:hypothetical protein